MITKTIKEIFIQRLGLYIYVISGVLFPGLSLAQNGMISGENGGKSLDRNTFEEYNVRLIPIPLLKMSAEQNNYVLLVDKSKQELYVYTYDGNYHKVKTYACTTGSSPGDKREFGDRKTPEGVYFFTQLWEESDLIEQYGKDEAVQYGIRAFDTNYPNIIDRINKKDGYGIWLHATDKPERIRQPYDTKGCIVLRNSDVDELTSFIKLNQTPVIVVKELKYVPESALRSESLRVVSFVESWKKSWEQRDFDSYGKSYGQDFSKDNNNIEAWLDYKRQILSRYEWLRITLSNIRIMKFDDYYFAEFHQTFQSDGYRDEGIKQLYIVNDGGKLKILSEQWTVVEPEQNKSVYLK